MKVKELKEILETFNDELEVFITKEMTHFGTTDLVVYEICPPFDLNLETSIYIGHK